MTDLDGKYSIRYVGNIPKDEFSDPNFLINISFRPASRTRTFDSWGMFNIWNMTIDPTNKWWCREFISESSVLSYLNNRYYGYQVSQAKVSAKRWGSNTLFKVYALLDPFGTQNGGWEVAEFPR